VWSLLGIRISRIRGRVLVVKGGAFDIGEAVEQQLQSRGCCCDACETLQVFAPHAAKFLGHRDNQCFADDQKRCAFAAEPVQCCAKVLGILFKQGAEELAEVNGAVDELASAAPVLRQAVS
jgi:hypothetical protein